MLALYLLGFTFILQSSGRQVPTGPPTGITVYRTATPGQYLVQPAPRHEVPQGYPQPITVLVVPRIAPEPSADGYSADPYIYYRQTIGTREFQNIKPQTLAYAQLIPYPPIKKRLYAKQKISIHQFLKEVTPTTKTAYSEQQAASLRYTQAAPPQEVDQDIQKLTLQRVVPHPFPYIIQSETPQDPNQPQPYQQLIHSQQYVQAPQNIQPQQNIQQPQQYIQQPQQYPGTPIQFTSREGLIPQQPKYQPTQLPPQQNSNSGLTYIPINPVMFQKPLVDDEIPSSTPKSSIYVSQKTSKKYQPPQPVQSVADEDSEEHLEKTDISRKVVRPLPRQYFPVHQPQQILLPIIPQQQPSASNEDSQTHIQPHFLKYHHFQQLQPAGLKYQQIQQEQAPEQQVFFQIRPKKVQPQLLREQSQQQLIAYQQIPLQQQQLQQNPRAYQQLQPTELVTVPRQPILKYFVQPQILTYQTLQPLNLRQSQIQPEPVEYETNQEETEPQQELQQQPEKNEEKQEVQLQESPQRQPSKVRKPNLRSRKYRPPRVQQESEEETHNENQETQENQEEFRIQYPDGLKPQATTYAGLRYRRPLQSTSRQLRNKDRAVQIIDDENEEYK